MKDNQSQLNDQEPTKVKKESTTSVAPSAKCIRSPDGKHYWREDAPSVKRCCYCGLILLP